MLLHIRSRWVRRLGLAAVPLIVIASLLGLLVGISGLCLGADAMAAGDLPMTLCVFFCGAIVAPAVAFAALWIVLGVLPGPTKSVPFGSAPPIFHPPTALPA